MAISDKLSSGRWLITMFAGVSLLGMTFADIIISVHNPDVNTLPFSPEALFAIISSVAAFYFSKPPEFKNDEETPSISPDDKKDDNKIDPPVVQ